MTGASTMGREPLTVVEIDQDFCVLSYGVAPCQAQLGVTGEHKCYNTLRSCQDTANFDPGVLTLRFCSRMQDTGLPKTLTVIPSVLTVEGTPAEINIGNDPEMGPLGHRASVTLALKDHPYHDRLVDPYHAERDFDPTTRGSFWSKWLARNPYYQGRPLRVLQGYVGQSLAEMRVRHYIIERIDGPQRGEVTIVAKDPLKLLDGSRVQVPRPSPGTLAAPITAAAVSFTLAPVGTGDSGAYPLSGVVLIGGELIAYHRDVADVCLVDGRGLRGTTAGAHAAGDLVQLVYVVDDVPLVEVLYELLVDYGGLPADFIPFEEWELEADRWLSGVNLSAWITQPTGISALVAEILAQTSTQMWWDEIAQLVRLRAIRPFFPTFDGIPPRLTDEANIVADSFGVEDRPDERVSQIGIYYEQINPTGGVDEPANYARYRSVIDQESETALQYGQKRIKTIFARWLGVGADAATSIVINRILERNRDTPRVISFATDAKDGEFGPGSVAVIEHRDVVDILGEVAPTLVQITASDEVDPGHRIGHIARPYQFRTRYAFIMVNGAPVYGDATPTERANGGWFIDGATLAFGNGDPPYRIL